jgi:DNA-binding NarL/FixJ family response regulator
MESMQDQISHEKNYHQRNHGAYNQRVVRMVPRATTQSASSDDQGSPVPVDAGEPATGMDLRPDIVLIIQDNVRRYSVEGMLHTADMGLSIQSIDNTTSLSKFAGSQLILSSSTASAPVPSDVAACLRDHPKRVLILVDPADSVDHTWADCAGGFIDWSDLCPASLGQALTDIASGRLYVSPTFVRRSMTVSAEMPDTKAFNALSMIAITPRENQVLYLLAEGLSNRQIATTLGISEHGVKRTVGIILAKLNCPNRTLAVVKAIELGLVNMDV